MKRDFSNSKLLTYAILSISMITVMASAAVSPALANISKAFPEASTSLIKTILTLPSLFIIPFSLLSGRLANRFGNKKVLLIGVLIYLIGGIGPAFVNTVPMVLFYRAVLGVGCGLIMPISQALIASNFEGSMKAKITGYSGAASYLMGVIASLVVAPISSIDWHYSFYIYLIALVVFLLNYFVLPADEPRTQSDKESEVEIPARVWWVVLGLLLINIAFYAVPANIALFMQEIGITNSRKAGYVISFFMVSGFIAGLLMGAIQKLVKSYLVLLGTAIMAVGYIVLSYTSEMLFISVGASLVGFSFGILFPAFMNLVNTKCSGRTCVIALSYASCFHFMGQFLSPFVLQGVKNVLGVTSLRYDFIVLAVSLSLATFIYLGYKIVAYFKKSVN